ncbi:MAG TPA: isoleucine--tRNA ligase [Chloroflexota bacterium]|nr:isoleucine--tRNA ligase [Chloroflexota bacterium]
MSGDRLGPEGQSNSINPTFEEVNSRVAFPALEGAIEQWWNDHDIVQKALQSGDPARPFVFFEGPPTANNRPGIHHVEARATKDVIVRFQRMRGHRIIGARAGWDTHGLPVEIAIEQQLGFSGKPDIERYGIAKFNEACRASVDRYIGDWERLTGRMAYWIDLSNPYVTYRNDYIESLWWILKTLWERGLLFRDYKVTMHCPRCGTSLSDHEVSLGFQDDVEDPSTWLRFRHRPSGHPLDARLANASFLAWTTTPWTLPANVALAVNPDAPYVLVENTNDSTSERLVLAEALATAVLGEGNYSILATFVGRDLTGLRYENLFTGVPAPGDTVDLSTAYRVIADEFVSLSDGTGIVHIAPAYGDLEIGRKYGLPTLFSVDLSGNILPEFDTLGFGGEFFKKADPKIIENLDERGLLFRAGRVHHAYPFCWRCSTPLLFYAKPSWYIRTTAKKTELVANNQQIHWVPEHIKEGRFGNWLENNVDWALSRERYWGTPLPIWVCDRCGETTVIGSVKELSEKAGRDLTQLDLHRPYVDEVTWLCPSCGGTMRRVPDVADAWFDSGSMPVAQWHYPFENQELFSIAGQADFISEAIDQTRGWFYTLHAVATLLFDRPAFRNVICLGHILDANGFKMSKSRGNVVDPWDLMESYGADATRWYMYASAPPYNPRRFTTEQVGDILREFTLTLWNTYAFFVTYANLDGWTPSVHSDAATSPCLQPIDRWALARLHVLVRDVTAMLEDYDVHGPAREIERFVEELSNWYVRRNRRRFWKTEDDADKHAAYHTLYTCLTTLARLLAPFAPYLSEVIYRNLVSRVNPNVPESVHLASWPEADLAQIDEDLLANTAQLQSVIALGRSARRSAGLRVRQPLSELLVRVQRVEGLKLLEDELRDELNVKSVRYLDVGDTLVAYRIKPNLPVVGRKYGKLVPALRKTLESLSPERARDLARRVEEGNPYPLTVDGQPIEIVPNEVLVEATSPPGYAVAEEEGLLVALNTTLTPELRLEGQARDLVRSIQDARKEANFAISDRIEVTLQPKGDFDPSPLLDTFGGYVKSETLANTLRVGPPAPDMHTVEVELDGGSVVIGVKSTGNL